MSAGIIFLINENQVETPTIDFDSDVCLMDEYSLSGTSTTRNGSVVVIYEHPVLPNSVPFGTAVVLNGVWEMKSSISLGGRKFAALAVEIMLA